MLIDYTSKFYESSARNHKRLIQDRGDKAKELVQWISHMNDKWDRVKVLDVEAGTLHDIPAHTDLKVKIDVHLSEIPHDEVTVDLY